MPQESQQARIRGPWFRCCESELNVGVFRCFSPLVPTGSECDDEDVEFEASDSDESWTTESAISSESILSSMCMNGGDEKPFACPVPGCKKRYKVCFTFIHDLSDLKNAFQSPVVILVSVQFQSSFSLQAEAQLQPKAEAEL